MIERPAFRDPAALACLLLVAAALCAAGVREVVGDAAAALPGLPAPAGQGPRARLMVNVAAGSPGFASAAPAGSSSAPPLVWRARACLGDRGCRGVLSTAFSASLAAHRGMFWAAWLAAAAAAVLGARLRVRARVAARPGASARFAGRAELRRLARSPEAWFPLGYALPRRGAGGRRAAAPASLRGGRAGARRDTGAISRRRPLCLPEEALARHVLVVGLTGAHKTTALAIPALLEAASRGVSVVALDLKYGEDDSLARTAGAWQRCGRDVLVFAPLDPHSLRWNPLAGCRTMGSAQHLAAMLFDDPDGADADLAYWMGVERHVCAALALAVVTDGGPPTMERLRRLCAGGPGMVRQFVQRHPSAAAFEALLGAYHAMLPKDEAGILQGIATRLEAWSDALVCRATGIGASWEEIDLGRLRREPVLLLVGIPQPSLARLRWLCRLLLQHLASCLLRPRGPSEGVRVLQVLEELPAWGPLPGLADHLATLRSRRVSVLATIQSEAQGEHVYGRTGWTAVAANLVTKIYCASLADLDADRLSRALGTAAVEDVTRNRGWGDRGRTAGEQRREIAAPLCPVETLQGVGAGENDVLVRCPYLPPARLWCPPFYVRPEYRGLVPDHAPATVDLAVYHHLWQRRHGERGVAGSASAVLLGEVAASPGPPVSDGLAARAADAAERASGVAAAAARAGRVEAAPGDSRSNAASGAMSPPDGSTKARQAGRTGDGTPGRSMGIEDPRTSLRPSGPLPPARAPLLGVEKALAAGGARALAAPTPEDTGVIERFAQALLAAGCQGAARAPRAVRRAGRLVELRVDPETAARLCGGPEALHALVRRWAELCWVRRVRPVMVLERRALEALAPALRKRLAEAYAPDAAPATARAGSSETGRPA